MRTILSLFLVLLFVIGCGGGDSVESPTVPEGSSEPEVVEPVEPDSVVPEEPMEPESPMEPDMTLAPWQCYNTDQETLVAFFEDVFYDDLSTKQAVPHGTPICGDGRLQRRDHSPVLRIAEGTPDTQRELTREGVSLLNLYIPDGYRIEIGTDSPPRAHFSEVPDDEIWIDFAPKKEWVCSGACPGSAVGGVAVKKKRIWIEHPREEDEALAFLFASSDCDRLQMKTIMHEILHTLGFCHADHLRWSLDEPYWVYYK